MCSVLVFVCVSVFLSDASASPVKSAEPHVVWDVDSGGPKEPCVR